VKLTAKLHLMLRLRMNGAIPPLILYCVDREDFNFTSFFSLTAAVTVQVMWREYKAQMPVG